MNILLYILEAHGESKNKEHFAFQKVFTSLPGAKNYVTYMRDLLGHTIKFAAISVVREIENISLVKEDAQHEHSQINIL